MELLGLDSWDIALRLLLGVVIGFCIGLTGVGGGVLGLQALALVLGMGPVEAVGTTGLYIFLTKISAFVHHARLRNVDWGTVVRLLAGALPANVLVAGWVSRHGGSGSFARGLEVFILCVVLACIFMMVLDSAVRLFTQKDHAIQPWFKRSRIAEDTLSVVSGMVLGGVIGATSLGGGCLIVPVLVVLFGMVAKQAVGTSIFIGLVLTCANALIYGRSGEVNVPTAVVMAAGSLLGVTHGSLLSVRLSDQLLRKVVMGLIVFAAGLMVIR